ncbi:MAG: UvrD-helicase domain-containing protein, partial [Oscillospiraceae bacterium]|nr:UvrD-helicase domain-containing protein [Oscillospiraceae bacterium]
MSFKPTPQQKAAINAPHNHSAIVTAAAGSGKTTLLVDRILRLLSEPSLNIRGDSLAILTFTRNAASSLRAKLISKMTERIKALSSDFSTEASALRVLLTEQMVALRSAS